MAHQPLRISELDALATLSENGFVPVVEKIAAGQYQTYRMMRNDLATSLGILTFNGLPTAMSNSAPNVVLALANMGANEVLRLEAVGSDQFVIANFTESWGLNIDGSTGNFRIARKLGSGIFELPQGEILLTGTKISVGAGNPNGVVTGNPGDFRLNTDGGSSTTGYLKESGTGTNTGWVAIAPGGGGSIATGASVHRNGVDQTGILDSTWTKIQFDTEEHDTSNQWDPITNYRFTPGVTGLMEVGGQLNWAIGASGGPIFIAIYKNGTRIRETQIVATGGNGDQCVTLPKIDINVTSPTDFFEIYGRQETGGTISLNGESSKSFASFTMV